MYNSTDLMCVMMALYTIVCLELYLSIPLLVGELD